MPSQSEVLTGYYRYNDIWFQWSDSLHPEEAAAMRGLFAHDCLIHNDHPFHVEGIEGVQMWQGTLVNGEQRLLFSSAQVNYIRYWLYTLGLTKKIISLPYSNCLLTEEELPSGVTPRVFKTGGELKKAQKDLDKLNKKLKRAGKLSSMMETNRNTFEYARKWWAAKRGAWLAIDIECWDLMHDVLTEFGWSAIYWEDGKEINESGHFRVQEYQHTRQTYVQSHPDKYQFGETEFVKKYRQVNAIKDIIAKFQAKGPLVLIFHDHRGDTKFLTQLGALETWEPIPKDVAKKGLFVIDTQHLFMALEGAEAAGSERSLQQVCNQLQVPTRYLHNAGNDAHYTLLAFRSMASGDTVDAQRSARWPAAVTSASLKAELNYDVNSDDDDDIMAAPAPSDAFD